MLKVKVQRYVAGKKPDFASSSSSDSEAEPTAVQTEDIKTFTSRSGFTKTRFTDNEKNEDESSRPTADELADPRFRRLMKAKVPLFLVY